MAKPFPQFTEPIPLPDGASWTAEFDSYDQRTDSAYYCITRTGKEGGGVQLWARVHCDGVPNEEQLRTDVGDVAASGEANTDHKGSMVWYMRHNPPPRQR
jgi:hypothetical protein